MSSPDFIPVNTRPESSMGNAIGDDPALGTQPAGSMGPDDRGQLNREIAMLSKSADPKMRAQSDVLVQERNKQDAIAKPNSSPDFIPAIPDQATTHSPDFIPAAPSAMKNQVGGLASALDTMLPIGSAVGGIAALGHLAMGHGLDAAVDSIHKYSDTLSPSALAVKAGVPDDLIHNQGYDTVAQPGAWLGEKVDQAGAATSGALQPYLGTSGAAQVGAAVNAGAQLAPFILGAKVGSRLSDATIRVDPPQIVQAKGVLADRVGQYTATVSPDAKPSQTPAFTKADGTPVLSPDQIEVTKKVGQLELPFSSDVTQGVMPDMFNNLSDASVKEPIPPDVITKVLSGVKEDTIKQQELFTRQELLKEAAWQDSEAKGQARELTPEQKAKQVDQLWSMNEMDANLDKLDQARIKQQFIDYTAEEKRPTSMEAAFGRALRGQRGFIDPDTFGMGKLADFIATLPEMYKTTRDKINALTDRYKGVFNGKALDELKFLSGDPTGKTTTTFMSPTQFHKLASVRDEGYTSESAGKRASVAEGLKTAAGLDSVPRLKIRTMADGTHRVIDHDGRHRMDELLRQGIEAVPVILEHVDKSWNESLNRGEPTPQVLFSQDGTPQPHPKVYNLTRSFDEASKIAANNEAAMYSSSGNALTKMPDGFQGVGSKQGGMLNLKAWYDPESASRDRKLDLTAFGISKTQAVFGRMNMPGTEFVKAWIKTFGENTLKNFDVWYHDFGSVTTSSFRSKNRLTSELSPGNIALSYFDDMIHLGKEEEHGLTKAVQLGFQDYESRYGVNPGRPFQLGDYKKDIAIAVKMEKDSSTWFNGKDYIPTAQDLMSHGMDAKSAAAWAKVHGVFDTVWQTLEKAAGYAGVRMPERVPGYIPHIFKGPYRVVLRDITDPANPKHLEEYNYFSLAAATKMFENNKGVLDGHPELTMEIESPKLMGKQTSQLINGLWEAKSLMDRNAGMSALLDSIYEGSVRGIVSAVLDRSQLTKAGHILSRINEPGELGLNRRQIIGASKMLRTVAEDVNGWYVRAKFVSDVLHPLQSVGLLNPERIQNAAKHYMESFFKIPDKLVPEMDWILRDDPWRSGLDPAIGANIARYMRSGFAKYYLMFKVPFYATNALQFTMGVPLMHMVKAYGLAQGEKTGSIAMSMAHTIINKDGAKLNKYAVEHGHADPGFMEQMDPSSFRDPIAVAIERSTRLMSFKMGYHYFKQIMDEKGALEAAGSYSNLVSVPYDPDVGAPIIMNRLPDSVKPFVLFASYNAHMISMASQTMRVTAVTLGNKSPHAFVYAAAGMIGLQALNMSLFGLTGIVGIGNYNSLVNEINEKFGTDVPDARVIGRALAKIALNSSGDIMAYGALSKYLGYDVSSSGQGATFSTPTAGLDAFMMLGQAAILALRYGASKVDLTQAPSQKEMWQWAKGLSTQWRGGIEYAIKDSNFKVTLAKMMGDLPDYSIGHEKGNEMAQDPGLPGQLRSGVPMLGGAVTTSPRAEMITHFVTGMTSLKESDTNTTNRALNVEKKKEEFDVSKTVQLLKEGNMSAQAQSEAISRLSIQWWKDPGKIMDEMINYKVDQSMTDDQRASMKGMNDMESMQWYMKWQAELSREPQRRQNGTGK